MSVQWQWEEVMSRERQVQGGHRLEHLRALRERFTISRQYDRALRAYIVVQHLYDRWADEVFAAAQPR